MLAAQGIALGDIDIAVAGGMESMSNAPYLLPRAREGLRMGDANLVDSMIHDGLWCAFEHCHMGMSGEHVAELYDVSREAQDRYAADSHQKAARAAAEGRFTAEMVRVEIPQAKGSPLVVDRDETIRPDSTVDALKGLKPAFKKDGSVTAGNSPGVNDGAAAVVVMSDERAASLGITPMARIAGYATSGIAPKLLLMTPVGSIRKLLARTRLATRRRRPLRDQRGIRGADGRHHQGTGTRCGARQRQRRRDRARSSHRRQRGTGTHDVAVRHEGARGEARHRFALPWRREWRSHGGRDVTKNEQRKANRNQRVGLALFVFRSSFFVFNVLALQNVHARNSRAPTARVPTVQL